MTLLRRLLLLLPLAACEVATLPNDAQRFAPPAVYRSWWALTEACSGLHGDFDAVEWYQIPNATSLTLPSGEVAQAMWLRAGNRIVLTGGLDGLYAGDLVRHEMLHALLRVGEHPRTAFIEHCGGVVVCSEPCDAGSATASAPDPAALIVDPTALEIGVEVTSTPNTDPGWEPYVMMVVTARNPSTKPWQVRLPPPGDPLAPWSFSFELEADRGEQRTYAVRANAPEVTRFAPGETKRFIFDFWVHGPIVARYDLTPGTWTFRGAYGGVWALQSPTLRLDH
jgi:hypothetical protein